MSIPSLQSIFLLPMAVHSTLLDTYLAAHSSAEDPLLTRLDRDTHLKVQMPHMSSGHVQGLLLEMMSRMIQPQRVLEIGTFTGYATICLARGLAPSGIVYTLDNNEELESIFSPYFVEAGLSHCIKFIAGHALDTIPTLTETWDLVYIDADKMNYARYYDLVIARVRPGGYIISDNVLRRGLVLQEVMNKETKNIHDYNLKLQADSRIEVLMLPLRDGLSIARKKG